MKKLSLKRLCLVSHKERAARIIRFHPKTTVLLGTNDTGKSTIIKSIYWALGAKPAIINSNWEAVGAVTLLDFAIDGEEYCILRAGRKFGLFTSRRELILYTSSITAELGVQLARMLDFKLVLTSRQGDTITPPPAYCFLPFYIDQDAGWQQPWRSFDALSQFSSWKRDVIQYHSGIRSNEYYVARSALMQARAQKNELEAQQNLLEKAFSEIEQRRKQLPVGFDPKVYQEAVSRMLRDLQSLQVSRQIIVQRINDLNSERVILDEQLKIAKRAANELGKDVDYMWNVEEDWVRCPVCGTDHKNSIANRYTMLKDLNDCNAVVVRAWERLNELDDEISRERNKLGQSDFRVHRVKQVLEEKKGKLKLKEYIDREAEQRMVALMNNQLHKLRRELNAVINVIKGLDIRIKKLGDPKRKTEIESYYLGRMLINLDALAVRSLSAGDVEKLEGNIKDTGSDLPRAVLAYFYAFIDTMRRYSDSPRGPLVVDSPIQQEPDKANHKKIVDLIFDKQPEGEQLVVGIVDLGEKEIQGSVIKLDVPYKVLRGIEYDEAAEIVRPYMEQFT